MRICGVPRVASVTHRTLSGGAGGLAKSLAKKTRKPNHRRRARTVRKIRPTGIATRNLKKAAGKRVSMAESKKATSTILEGKVQPEPILDEQKFPAAYPRLTD